MLGLGYNRWVTRGSLNFEHRIPGPEPIKNFSVLIYATLISKHSEKLLIF